MTISPLRFSACLFILLLLPSCATLPAARDRSIARQLDQLLHRHHDKGVSIAARVIELPSRREIYACNADRPMMPASNMKLVTTAAAADFLGPDHVFKTLLVRQGGDFWVLGSGDPAFGDPLIGTSSGRRDGEVLDRWADVLVRAGFPKRGGTIGYWTAAFEARRLHRTWELDDLGRAFAAPVSGLNYHTNCRTLTLAPSSDGGLATIAWDALAPPPYVTGGCTSGGTDEPVLEVDLVQDVVILGGSCRRRTQLKVAVPDPVLFLAQAQSRALSARDVEVEAFRFNSDPLPPISVPPATESILALHETPLAAVLRRTNKDSQNLYAECLFKTLGRASEHAAGRDVPGSWENGSRAVSAFFETHGIDHRRLRSADGSGLSRWNRVTAHLLTDLLAVMHDHPAGDVFRDSLAVAGRDGTLKGRMKDLEGRVLAKTGFLTSVRALSGYVRTDDGRWLAFSFLFNEIDGSVKPFEDIQDDACRLLARGRLDQRP